MEQTQPVKPNIPLIMGSIMSVLLLAALDSTVVGTAMPKIIADLHGMAHYAGPFTAYMLCSTLSIVISGKLSDLFGRKPILLWGIVIFLFASTLCGFSPTMVALIIFRGLQGIGGGIIFSSVFITVGELFSPRERGKYMGLIAATFGVSSVFGPAVGGFLTDALSWRWVFFINLPIGIFAFIAIIIALPKFKSDRVKANVDFAGAAAVGACLVPLLLAFMQAGTALPWSSPQVIGLLCFSAVMAVVFYKIEQKAADPILSPMVFKNRVFNISILSAFLSNAAMFGAILYVPLFAQAVLGKSAAGSGAVTTPMMLSMTGSIAISGQAISRTGKYKFLVILGFLMACVGSFLFSTLTVESSGAKVLIYSMLLGMGVGLSIPVFTLAVQNAFDHRELGMVTSSLQFFRNLGATIGSSAFGYLLAAGITKGEPSFSGIALPADAVRALHSPRTLADSTALEKIRIHLSGEALSMFDTLAAHSRAALGGAIQRIFITCSIVSALALIAAFFLPELTLRTTTSHKPTES